MPKRKLTSATRKYTKSVYQSWLDAGNTGSEQDFLDSLVGATGADGVDAPLPLVYKGEFIAGEDGYIVSHNLNTHYIQISLYIDNSNVNLLSDWAIIVDTNTIKIYNLTEGSTYRIVITGY